MSGQLFSDWPQPYGHWLLIVVTIIMIDFIFKWIQINRPTQPLDTECVTIFKGF